MVFLPLLPVPALAESPTSLQSPPPVVYWYPRGSMTFRHSSLAKFNSYLEPPWFHVILGFQAFPGVIYVPRGFEVPRYVWGSLQSLLNVCGVVHGHWSTQAAKDPSPAGSCVRSISSAFPIHSWVPSNLPLLLPYGGGQGPFPWQLFLLWGPGPAG